MKLAILLLTISTLLLFNGCAKQPDVPKVVYVPQKCNIQYIEPPVIDNAKYDKPNEIVAKALSNYVKMKEYAEKLLEAQSVCE